MNVQKILLNTYLFLRNAYYRKIFRKEKKQWISNRKIDYSSFWKKYDKHYNNIAHNFYFQKTGIDSKYYIPDDFYYTVLDEKCNDTLTAKFLDNKTLYDKFFPFIKLPKTYAKRINGDWYMDDKPTTFESVVKSMNQYEEVICKRALNSAGGSGVKFYTKDNYEKLNELGKDLVVQEVVKQCSEMNKLNKTSLNTVRVMTLLLHNKVEVVSCYVRFGLHGKRVDNASVGGATCGIKDNGQLKSIAFKSDGTKYDKNPNNGIAFDSLTIPVYDKIKEAAIKCHSSFPYFKLISWDFAVDDEYNPVFIEGNFKDGGLDDHQLNNGPLFGDKLEYYLKELLK